MNYLGDLSSTVTTTTHSSNKRSREDDDNNEDQDEDCDNNGRTTTTLLHPTVKVEKMHDNEGENNHEDEHTTVLPMNVERVVVAPTLKFRPARAAIVNPGAESLLFTAVNLPVAMADMEKKGAARGKDNCVNFAHKIPTSVGIACIFMVEPGITDAKKLDLETKQFFSWRDTRKTNNGRAIFAAEYPQFATQSDMRIKLMVVGKSVQPCRQFDDLMKSFTKDFVSSSLGKAITLKNVIVDGFMCRNGEPKDLPEFAYVATRGKAPFAVAETYYSEHIMKIADGPSLDQSSSSSNATAQLQSNTVISEIDHGCDTTVIRSGCLGQVGCTIGYVQIVNSATVPKCKFTIFVKQATIYNLMHPNRREIPLNIENICAPMIRQYPAMMNIICDGHFSPACMGITNIEHITIPGDKAKPMRRGLVTYGGHTGDQNDIGLVSAPPLTNSVAGNSKAILPIKVMLKPCRMSYGISGWGGQFGTNYSMTLDIGEENGAFMKQVARGVTDLVTKSWGFLKCEPDAVFEDVNFTDGLSYLNEKTQELRQNIIRLKLCESKVLTKLRNDKNGSLAQTSDMSSDCNEAFNDATTDTTAAASIPGTTNNVVPAHGVCFEACFFDTQGNLMSDPGLQLASGSIVVPIISISVQVSESYTGNIKYTGCQFLVLDTGDASENGGSGFSNQSLFPQLLDPSNM